MGQHNPINETTVRWVQRLNRGFPRLDRASQPADSHLRVISQTVEEPNALSPAMSGLRHLNLGLTDSETADVVEYLKSL